MKLTWLLPFLVTVSVFTSDLYLASMPHMTEYFGTSDFHVQLSLSIYLIGFSIAVLLAGPLSDRFGIKHMVVSALAAYSASSLLIVYSPSIEWLLAGRLVQSFGGGFCSILSRAIVRQEYPKELRLRMFAYLFMAMGMTALLAPILGSTLFLYFGWKANFIYMSLYSLSLLTACFFILPHGTVTVSTSFIQGYATILKNSDYMTHLAVMVLLWSGFMAFVIEAPFIFISYLSTTPLAFSYFYSLSIAGFIGGSFLARLHRFSVRQYIIMGTFLSLFASLILVFNCFYCHPLFLAVPMSLYLMGLGMVLPSIQSLASDLFNESETARAFGLMFFLKMMIGTIIGTLIALENTSINLFAGAIVLLSASSILILQSHYGTLYKQINRS